MKQVNNLSDIPYITHGFYNRHNFQQVVRPVLMTQVHSADVLVLDKYTDEQPMVDALVTKCPNLALTVKTADCAPVLLADSQHQIIGAVHAGWKGAFQGILENTVLTMLKQGADVSCLHAGIGPCLHKESFQVGADFQALFPKTEHHFFELNADGHLYFDFLAYICYRLERIGIPSVQYIDIDTYQSADYFSYRRQPENPGRQYSVIQIKQ